jgi:hypothetical protein
LIGIARASVPRKKRTFPQTFSAVSNFAALSNFVQTIAQLSASSAEHRKTEKENEMGPHTLYIIYAAGAIVASLVAYLVYSSFKRT